MTAEIRQTHLDVLRAMANKDHFDYNKFIADVNSSDPNALKQALDNAPSINTAQFPKDATGPEIAKSAFAREAEQRRKSERGDSNTQSRNEDEQDRRGSVNDRNSFAGNEHRLTSDPNFERPTYVQNKSPAQIRQEKRQKKMLLRYLKSMMRRKPNGKMEKMPVDEDNSIEEIREEIEYRKEIRRRNNASDAACDALVLGTQLLEKGNKMIGDVLPINNLNKSIRVSVPTRFRPLMPDVLDELFPNGVPQISPVWQMVLGVVAVAGEHIEGGHHREGSVGQIYVRQPNFNAGDEDDNDKSQKRKDDDDDDDDSDADIPMPDDVGMGGGADVNRSSTARDAPDDGMYGYGDQDTGGGGGGIAGAVAMAARFLAGDGV